MHSHLMRDLFHPLARVRYQRLLHLWQNMMPIFITAPGVPDIGINWRAFISDSARQPLMSFNEPFRAGNPWQLELHELRLINLPDLLQVPIGCLKEEEDNDGNNADPVPSRLKHAQSGMTHRNQLRNQRISMSRQRRIRRSNRGVGVMTSWQADINSTM